MHLHEYTNEFHTTFLVYFSRLNCPSQHRSHIIRAQTYQILEVYWKANAISYTVAIIVFTDTSDDEYTIAKFKTCVLECTYCAVGIRPLILA